MAEAIFPYVGLPMSLIALAIGGIMLRDILSAHGKTEGPDGFGRRNRLSASLVKEARLGQDAPPPSKGAMWVPFIVITSIGGIMLWSWVMRVFG